MSLRRTLKKAYYAALAVALVTVVLVVVSFIIVPRPPTAELQPTPASEFSPIEVRATVVIPHPSFRSPVERSVDLVTMLRNPNLRAGVGQYILTYTLLDTEGQPIETVSVTTYLLPGALQYATAFDVRFPVDRRLGRVELTPPSDVQFVRLPDTVGLPSFNLFLRDRTSRPVGETVVDVQTGVITNTSTLDWQRVEVLAVALDESDTVVAIGQTFVGKLLVGEQREFSVQWPKPPQTINRVIALPSTNIFREDNIVDIIGDPGRLR
jgi:hypothetical protein